MRVLGISPLDKDANASVVEDGKILFAAGEERFSRQKQHAGFPYKAIEAALAATGWKVEDIDVVAYAFLTPEQEHQSLVKNLAKEADATGKYRDRGLQQRLREAERRVPTRMRAVPGLSAPNQRMDKPVTHRLFYRLFGGDPQLSHYFSLYVDGQRPQQTLTEHQHWHTELERGLRHFGLTDKLKRYEHHLSHAANSYLASGLDRALIVTIDGYGTGLAGSVSVGEGGKIKRLHNIPFPHSLGSFYETVTASLGFKPDRHAGKIVGLAAYGDPAVLSDVLLHRCEETDGDFRIYENLNVYFSRHLALRFPMIDVAAAYQYVLEQLACRLVAYWVKEAGIGNVVLSGGVTANVKMNQRIMEIAGVKTVFVYPNMGDGGCGTGLALYISWPGGVGVPLDNVYLGPSYNEAEIQAALDQAGLQYTRPANLAAEVAKRINAGEVVARFDGRMEYGPRALGNRSILYHGRDPEVNQWLNQRLGRTEFMPFAPVTLWEARDKCYRNVASAAHAAEFMTVTFDCTEFQRSMCPAAVHVDNTARPQLIRREKNPGYYDIVKEYEKISGSPSMINTSFNMHEEPIVCSPQDAVRAFLDGRIDGLAAGPFYVEHPAAKKQAENP
jgi:carbamoyltransferase